MPSSQVCYKQPGPPPPTASCYICLENSEDSNNQPLLRNCACRGDDAGWAHVACLAEFAASKITEAQRNKNYSVNIEKVWKQCIVCKTPYMQNMAMAMAKACVKIYEDFPDSPETDKMRWFALDYMALINVDFGNHKDALKSYNRLLKNYEIVAGQGRDVRRRKANVLAGMMLVAMKEDRMNDAIALLERNLEIIIDLEGPNSSIAQEKNQMLTSFRSMIGEGCDHEVDTAAEVVRARQRYKELQEEDNPEETLSSHRVVVRALIDDGKIEQATEQLEILLSDSRRALGPDHPATLQFENYANDFYTSLKLKQKAGGAISQKKDVWAVIDYEKKPAIHGRRVKVLKATKKDPGIYICQIKNRNGVSTKVKVVRDQFILETGTAVVVYGLVSSADLNGSIGFICSFDKEKRRYAVSVEKKKTAVLIRPINLYIAFETVELKL